MSKTIRTTSVEPGMTLEAYIWHTPSNRVPHIVKVLSKEGTHPKTGMTIVMDKFTAESDGVSMSVMVDGEMKRVTFKTVGDNNNTTTVKEVKAPKESRKVADNSSSNNDDTVIVQTKARVKKSRADDTIVLPMSGTPYKTLHEIRSPNGGILEAVWDFNGWWFNNESNCEPRKLAAHGFRYIGEKVVETV